MAARPKARQPPSATWTFYRLCHRSKTRLDFIFEQSADPLAAAASGGPGSGRDRGKEMPDFFVHFRVAGDCLGDFFAQ